MTLRILVQLLICLLVIPLMGGFIDALTKGISIKEFVMLLGMTFIVVLMLWGSNFIGRMAEEEWKQKFEKQYNLGIKYVAPIVALLVLLNAAVSLLIKALS